MRTNEYSGRPQEDRERGNPEDYVRDPKEPAAKPKGRRAWEGSAWWSTKR